MNEIFIFAKVTNHILFFMRVEIKRLPNMYLSPLLQSLFFRHDKPLKASIRSKFKAENRDRRVRWSQMSDNMENILKLWPGWPLRWSHKGKRLQRGAAVQACKRNAGEMSKNLPPSDRSYFRPHSCSLPGFGGNESRSSCLATKAKTIIMKLISFSSAPLFGTCVGDHNEYPF